jgi:hypothetical protein
LSFPANVLKDFLDLIKQRSVAYNQTFGEKNRYAHYVLKDLARFCRANESTFNPDPRAHAVLEGRREVWLRIQEHLNLTPEQVYALHPLKDGKGLGVGLPANGVSATQMNRSTDGRNT